MLKINHLGLLLVMAVLIAGCATPGSAPLAYRTNPGDMDKMTTGCWIYINQGIKTGSTDSNSISGELITIQQDTFYILTSLKLAAIPAKKIESASLLMFKEQSSRYLLVTGLGLIPNVLGAAINGMSEFLLIGIPFAVVGSITAAIDINANVLQYPGRNSLTEFGHFARFPQGRPSGVNLEELTLKESAQ
jgi:hypothetical protein